MKESNTAPAVISICTLKSAFEITHPEFYFGVPIPTHITSAHDPFI